MGTDVTKVTKQFHSDCAEGWEDTLSGFFSHDLSEELTFELHSEK